MPARRSDRRLARREVDPQKAARHADFRAFWRSVEGVDTRLPDLRGLKADQMSADYLPVFRFHLVVISEIAAYRPDKAAEMRLLFAAVEEAIRTIEAGNTTERRMAEMLEQSRRMRQAA